MSMLDGLKKAITSGASAETSAVKASRSISEMRAANVADNTRRAGSTVQHYADIGVKPKVSGYNAPISSAPQNYANIRR